MMAGVGVAQKLLTKQDCFIVASSIDTCFQYLLVLLGSLH